jgi:hypothetical protein
MTPMAYVDDGAVHVTAQTGQDDQPLVTLAEAAALTGRSLVAVRAALRRDLDRPEDERRLKARKNNAGEWLIAVPVDWRRQTAPHAGRQDGHTPATDAAQAGQYADDTLTLAGRLGVLEEAVAGRLADLQRNLATAHVALAKAEGERDAAQAVALAKEQAAERLIAELRAQLTEARRPWWARLVSRH